MERVRWFCIFAAAIFITAAAANAESVTVTYGPFDVTFHNNGDSDGLYSGVADWTTEQMADVAASIGTWASQITDTPARQVRLHLFWSELDNLSTATLGGSSIYRLGDGQTQWTLPEYVWRQGNYYGSTTYGYDSVIRLDVTAAGYAWNFGDALPDALEVDFRSVVTHEIGHSLGFLSSYSYSFDDWGWLGSSYQGITEWDKNLIDAEGDIPRNGTRGTPGDFNEKGNPVYWTGQNAVDLYGGLVPIYAPLAYKPGSSLAHLDEALLSDYLMSPSLNLGQTIRDVSALEWAMMTDMGWTIIPEPATITIMLLGTAFLTRRNKK